MFNIRMIINNTKKRDEGMTKENYVNLEEAKKATNDKIILWKHQNVCAINVSKWKRKDEREREQRQEICTK